MSAPTHPEPRTVLKHRLQRRSDRFTGPRQEVFEVRRRQRRPVSTSNGYREVTHRLGFFGICPRCQ